MKLCWSAPPLMAEDQATLRTAHRRLAAGSVCHDRDDAGRCLLPGARYLQEGSVDCPPSPTWTCASWTSKPATASWPTASSARLSSRRRRSWPATGRPTETLNMVRDCPALGRVAGSIPGTWVSSTTTGTFYHRPQEGPHQARRLQVWPGRWKRSLPPPAVAEVSVAGVPDEPGREGQGLGRAPSRAAGVGRRDPGLLPRAADTLQGPQGGRVPRDPAKTMVGKVLRRELVKEEMSHERVPPPVPAEDGGPTGGE